MKNETALAKQNENISPDAFDFDELEAQLNSEINSQIAELDLLEASFFI